METEEMAQARVGKCNTFGHVKDAAAGNARMQMEPQEDQGVAWQELEIAGGNTTDVQDGYIPIFSHPENNNPPRINSKSLICGPSDLPCNVGFICLITEKEGLCAYRDYLAVALASNRRHHEPAHDLSAYSNSLQPSAIAHARLSNLLSHIMSQPMYVCFSCPTLRSSMYTVVISVSLAWP
jgi:hypothetical protein